jgi:hypothetical protein
LRRELSVSQPWRKTLQPLSHTIMAVPWFPRELEVARMVMDSHGGASATIVTRLLHVIPNWYSALVVCILTAVGLPTRTLRLMHVRAQPRIQRQVPFTAVYSARLGPLARPIAVLLLTMKTTCRSGRAAIPRVIRSAQSLSGHSFPPLTRGRQNLLRVPYAGIQ